MERRDYLKIRIEQLGRVLGKIFSELLGLKNQGQVAVSINVLRQSLENELDFDLEKLLSMETGQWIGILKKEKEFDNENLERLADIFSLFADNMENNKMDMKVILYKECLEVYEYLEQEEGTYSLDRHFKMGQMQDKISGKLE